MYATTVTNADGTFSPAIVWNDRVWVCSDFCNKSENMMIKLAQDNARKIGKAVENLLQLGHYRIKT